MTTLARINRQLDDFESKGLTRYRYPIDHYQNDFINFSGNDYLALTKHPAIKQAFIASANKYGLGSGASPQLSGYTTAHQRLEEAFAEHLNRQRAILFNSGYHANLGVITTLATRKSTIIADKYCHASIIDAIVLSRANHLRYAHNDIDQAINLLQKNPDSLVVTESVFSIQGTITPINKLAPAAMAQNSFLIVDDAHGIGVLGAKGRGICEHFNLSQTTIPCLITPLGKAFASMGAIVSGSNELIEALLQFAKPYRYSTAIPAAICDATFTAMQIMRMESWRIEQLNARIQFFIKEALARELSLTSLDLTPIKSIIVKSNNAALSLQSHLKDAGFLVSCIRPPTVPAHQAMMRISLNCEHTETQIISLLDEIMTHANFSK
jgi:8-amino-7-oxononanoate synthase